MTTNIFREQIDIESRYIYSCQYMLATGCTLRDVQNIFRIPKSTLHHFIHTKLEDIDETLYSSMVEFLKENQINGRKKGGKVCQFRKHYQKEADKDV